MEIHTKEQCPNCHSEGSFEAHKDINTGEEFCHCDLCGYMRNRYIKRNEYGDILFEINEYGIYNVFVLRSSGIDESGKIIVNLRIPVTAQMSSFDIRDVMCNDEYTYYLGILVNNNDYDIIAYSGDAIEKFSGEETLKVFKKTIINEEVIGYGVMKIQMGDYYSVKTMPKDYHKQEGFSLSDDNIVFATALEDGKIKVLKDARTPDILPVITIPES